MLHQLYTSREDDENINQKRLQSFKPLKDQEIIELIKVQKTILHNRRSSTNPLYYCHIKTAQERNLDVELHIRLDYIIHSS